LCWMFFLKIIGDQCSSMLVTHNMCGSCFFSPARRLA
jgi:hypothetical protein